MHIMENSKLSDQNVHFLSKDTDLKSNIDRLLQQEIISNRKKFVALCARNVQNLEKIPFSGTLPKYAYFGAFCGKIKIKFCIKKTIRHIFICLVHMNIKSVLTAHIFFEWIYCFTFKKIILQETKCFLVEKTRLNHLRKTNNNFWWENNIKSFEKTNPVRSSCSIGGIFAYRFTTMLAKSNFSFFEEGAIRAILHPAPGMSPSFWLYL
jgi:hypothetical protein